MACLLEITARYLRQADVARVIWIVLFVAAVPADISAQSDNISQGEAYVFLGDYSSRSNMCDANWLGRQFLDSAKISFRYSDGKRDVFSPSEFVELMGKNCQPYRIEWDQRSFRVSSSGSRASGEWKQGWGIQAGYGETRRSSLEVSCRIDIVKRHGEIRVAQVKHRMRELVPGAEQEYWARTGKVGLTGAADKMYQGVFDRLRAWWEARNQQKSP